MGLKMIVAGVCAAAMAATMLTADAGAQSKKKQVTANSRVVVAKRPSARIRVQPRSFLDGGTELLPGERKFTDYAIPPYHRPTQIIDNTAFNRNPYPNPIDVPGSYNGW